MPGAAQRAVRRTALLTGLLLVAGCSGEQPPARSGAPTPPPAGSSVPAVASTAAPRVTAGSLPPPSRGPEPAVGPATDGDVDGDGRVDAVSATLEELRVALSGGGTVTAPVVDADTEPVVQGVVDVDRDGYGEVFLETARGASTGFVQLYRYDGGRLRELKVRGGHARFGFGGSVTHGEGFTCTPQGRFVVRRAESDDGQRFRVRTRVYRVAGAGSASELVQESETTVEAAGAEDPRVRAAYEVSCGPVGDAG